MSVKGLCRAAALGAPLFIVSAAQGKLTLPRQKKGLHSGNGGVVPNLTGLVQMINTKGPVHIAVLDDQQPFLGVENGGLSGGIGPVYVQVPAVQIQLQMPAPLEIVHRQPKNFDFLHLDTFLSSPYNRGIVVCFAAFRDYPPGSGAFYWCATASARVM